MRAPNSTEEYHNLWESSVGAAKGFFNAIRCEKKIRQVFIAVVTVTIICKIMDVGYFQILMVIFSGVVALICEILNTALEKAMDYACGKEFHPLIKQGKDYAAACTFVALIFGAALTVTVIWARYFEDDAPRKKIFQSVSVVDLHDRKSI